MKKYIISLMLILTLVFSTAVTFAGENDGDGTGAGNDPAVEQGSGDEEGGDGNIVDGEEAGDQEEPLVEEGEEADPEAKVDEEEPAPAAPEGAKKGGAPVLTKNEDPGLDGGSEEPAVTQMDWNETCSWVDDSHSQAKDSEGNIVTGLFKAKRKHLNQGTSLFYADENGNVIKSECIITITNGRVFKHTNLEGEQWKPVDEPGTATYAITNHKDGSYDEYYVYWQEGEVTVNGVKYYVKDDGTVRTNAGFQTMPDGSKVYVTEGGPIQTAEGLVTVDGSKYIVKAGGKVNTATGIQTCSGKKYYVKDSTGAIQTAQGFTPAVNGSKYVVQADGSIKTNVGFITVSGKKYYVAAGGAVRTKAGSFKANNGKYYLAEGGGAIVTKKGIQKRSGKYYYVTGTSGVLAVNKVQKVGKKKYHVTANGVISVGPHKWKNVYYYSTKAGVLQQSKKINKWTNGKYYFTKKGGKLYVNTKFKVKGKTYIANKAGVIQTGFFTWKKGHYYASKKGVLRVKKGVLTVDLYKYYVYSGGKIAINKKVKAGKKTYFATDDDGHLKKGVFKWKDGKYYYTYKSGAMMAKEAMFTYNGKKYYNKKGGSLAVKSFVKSNDKYYYCGPEAYVLTKPFTYKGKTIRPNSKTGEIDEEIYYELFPNERPDDPDIDE